MKNVVFRKVHVSFILMFTILYTTRACRTSKVDLEPFIHEQRRMISGNKTDFFPGNRLVTLKIYHKHIGYSFNDSYLYETTMSKTTKRQRFNESALNNTRAAYVHLRYIYTQHKAGVATEYGQHDIKGERYSDVCGNDGQLTYIADHFIAVGHNWCTRYAHFVYDAVLPLFLIPLDIINKAYIINNGPRNIPKQFFEIMGISSDRIISKRGYILAINYHMIWTPHEVHGCISFLPKLGKKVLDYYGIKCKPSMYCVQNRNSPKRKIINIDELMDALNKTYSKYEWSLLPEANDLNKIAKSFSQVKCIFMTTGSGFSNTMFMENGTGVVCAQGNVRDTPVFAACIVMGVFCSAYRVKNVEHGTMNWNLSVADALEAVDKVLYAIENHKFPSAMK